MAVALAWPSLRNRCHRRVTAEQRALSPATSPPPAPLGPPARAPRVPTTPPRRPAAMGATGTPPNALGPRVENPRRGARGLYKFYWPRVTVSPGTFALCRGPALLPAPTGAAAAPPLSRALCSELAGGGRGRLRPHQLVTPLHKWVLSARGPRGRGVTPRGHPTWWHHLSKDLAVAPAARR